MKASLLALMLTFSVLFSSAQEKSADPVLIFSGSNIGFSHYGSRNIRADTSIGRSNNWGIGSGVMYGQWKGNTLLFYGVSFGYSGISNFDGGKGNGFSISPTIGLLKKIPIGGPISYVPNAEYFIGYTRNFNTGQGPVTNGSNAIITGINGYPFSLSVEATKKLEVMLTLGSVNVWYSNTGYRGEPQTGAERIRNTVFSISGQLNSLGVRLLLKI